MRHAKPAKLKTIDQIESAALEIDLVLIPTGIEDEVAPFVVTKR